ncbi:MAG: carboxymuconolactone decarboxylase family protein [Planctomycetaceae bacterium]
MPRLTVVEPDQAADDVKQIYNGLEAKMGKVINIFKGMGNSSAALNAYLSMSGALKQGELLPDDREIIYLAVSEMNGCEYCVAAHTMISQKSGMTDNQILAARRWEAEEPKHQALLNFVRQVIDKKGFVSDEELTAVRDAGYSDGQIAETIAFIGLATYSNLFNHVFDTPLDFPEVPKLS